jgi:hypothetical protein
LTPENRSAHTSAVPIEPTTDARLLSAMAAALGRRGGRKKSAVKATKARENGKKGGRPKKAAK